MIFSQLQFNQFWVKVIFKFEAMFDIFFLCLDTFHQSYYEGL